MNFCVAVSVSLIQHFFCYSDTVAPGKKFRSTKFIDFFPSRCVHFLILIITGWCNFRFSLSYDYNRSAAFCCCFYILLFICVQSFERFIFNCTIIFEYRNLRFPSYFCIVRASEFSSLSISILRSFINMFYCTFECVFPYAMGAMYIRKKWKFIMKETLYLVCRRLKKRAGI